MSNDLTPSRWLLESVQPSGGPGAKVRFNVPSEGIATLRVYTTLGEQLKTLFNGMVEAGRDYTVEFSAEDLPTGFYLARLDHQGRHVLRRIMLTR